MSFDPIDTLLELYDTEPILNVAGAWYLQPRSIVFFYYELAEDALALRKELAQLFNRIGLRCNVRLERLERLDVRDMLDWVREHQHELGTFALELTGGDDEMLFSAGLCYASFPCRLFSCKPDGRYIALPSGEEVKPGKGEFAVVQRLMLNDVTLDRFGRLTPKDLKLPLLQLAHQLLDLQRKHPQQWTEQTRCIQQCVARTDDQALTVLLDADTCAENHVATGKSKLLSRLLHYGALTELKSTPEGIWVTFPNQLIRDCLCDYGIWLEIAAYDALTSCGAFDDVQLSCIVKWANEKLVNELDVVATAGMGLMLVSCKTCAPDLKAVAELNVLGDRFGSTHTHTVLLCLPRPTERLDNIRARCDEMDVQLIDLRQYDREGLRNFFLREGKKMRAGKHKS